MALLRSIKDNTQPDLRRRKTLDLIMELLFPHRNDLQNFEVALLGYDRQQVEQYLEDVTARLREALYGLDAKALLHQQLYEACCEVDRLQGRGRTPTEDLPWPDRISQILEIAEEHAAALRSEAKREAEQIRARAMAESLQARRDLEAALRARRKREQRLEKLLPA